MRRKSDRRQIKKCEINYLYKKIYMRKLPPFAINTEVFRLWNSRGIGLASYQESH